MDESKIVREWDTGWRPEGSFRHVAREMLELVFSEVTSQEEARSAVWTLVEIVAPELFPDDWDDRTRRDDRATP